MFKVVEVMPLEGTYQHNALQVVQQIDGTILVTWSEIVQEKYFRSRLALRHPDGRWVVCNLDNSPPILAVCPLNGSLFGLVRLRRFIYEAADFGGDSHSLTFAPIGRRDTGGDLDLFAMEGGAIGLNLKDTLFVHIPNGSRTFITAVEHDFWTSGATVLANGQIVRVVSGSHDHYQHPPQYTISGTIFDSHVLTMSEFSFRLPSRVISNTYAHPDRLRVAALPKSGFVIAWTLNSAHLGNLIELQQFDEIGNALGPTQLVEEADQHSHLTLVNCVAINNGSVVLTYLHRHDPRSRTQVVRIDLASRQRAEILGTDWSESVLDIRVSGSQQGQFVVAEAGERTVTIKTLNLF